MSLLATCRFNSDLFASTLSHYGMCTTKVSNGNVSQEVHVRVGTDLTIAMLLPQPAHSLTVNVECIAMTLARVVHFVQAYKA